MIIGKEVVFSLCCPLGEKISFFTHWFLLLVCPWGVVRAGLSWGGLLSTFSILWGWESPVGNRSRCSRTKVIHVAFFFLTSFVSLSVKVKVTQSCSTLCDPVDYTVHRILQARILEWVAVAFSRGSSQPRNKTQVSRIAGGFFTSWATREAQGSPGK